MDKSPKKKAVEPKYIIDPKDVSPKDDLRCRRWAAEMMKKNEHKLDTKYKDRQIITRGEIDPEDIDVKNIYPFPELHWIIYRDGVYFAIMLCSKHRMLFTSSFVKI